MNITMITARRNHSIYFFILFGVTIGLCFPLIFILLDLKQLGLQISLTNMYEVFESQNIYTFSSTLFPILFGTIGGLFFHIFSQNKKLALQENYINNVLNSLSDCILVCNSKGVIQYANSAFYGLYDNEIKSILPLLGISNLDSTSIGKIHEVNLINKSGEERASNYTVTSSVNENSFIITIRDVQEFRLNEKTIEIQKAQLFEASKLSALGQMASGFAHEINNPLAIMNGKLMHIERELNKEDFSKEIVLKGLETNKKMIVRITKIIKGLRTLSHSNTDEQPEIISIKDLVEDFMIMASLKLTGRDIEFKVDIEKVEKEFINCNPVQISQVLMNLFNNAIDVIENEEFPWFSLQIEKVDDNFKFTISDSGKGIPLELQKKIFEPMFTTKAIGKGTGLGLSISRAIIEKHQGKIFINNASPNTCFQIYLPADIKQASVA